MTMKRLSIVVAVFLCSIFAAANALAQCGCDGTYRIKIWGVGELASGAKISNISFAVNGAVVAPVRSTVTGGGAGVLAPFSTTNVAGERVPAYAEVSLDALQELKITWTEVPNNGETYTEGYGYRLHVAGGCGTALEFGSVVGGVTTWVEHQEDGADVYMTDAIDAIAMRPLVINKDETPGDAESNIRVKFVDNNSDGTGDTQEPPSLHVSMEGGEYSSGSNGRIVSSATLSTDLIAAIASSDPGDYLLDGIELHYDEDYLNYSSTSTSKTLKSGSTEYLKAYRSGSGSTSQLIVAVYDRKAGNSTARTHTFKRESNGGVNMISHLDSLTGIKKFYWATSNSGGYQWKEEIDGGDLEDGSASIVSGKQRVTKTLTKGGNATTSREDFLLGNRLVESVSDPSGIQLKTTTEYWDSAGQWWNLKPKVIREYAGSQLLGWTAFYYETSGSDRIEWMYEPWESTPSDAPNFGSGNPGHTYSGKVTKTTYSKTGITPERIDYSVEEIKVYAQGGNLLSEVDYEGARSGAIVTVVKKERIDSINYLTTRTKRYSSVEAHISATDEKWRVGRVIEVTKPHLNLNIGPTDTADRDLEAYYKYSENSNYRYIESFENPVWVSGNVEGLSKTVSTYSIADGERLDEVETFVRNGSSWSSATTTEYVDGVDLVSGFYQRYNRVEKDGVVISESRQINAQTTQSKDASGIVTTTEYNDSGQIFKETRTGYSNVPAIVSTHSYTTSSGYSKHTITETGGSNSRTSYTLFDDAGRVYKTGDGLYPLETTYSYSYSGGETKTTVTAPDGGKVATTNYRDGRIKQSDVTVKRYNHSGSIVTDPVVSATYEYNQNVTEIQTADRWEKTTTDLMGRIKEVHSYSPGSSTSTVRSVYSYDNRGRLNKIEKKLGTGTTAIAPSSQTSYTRYTSPHKVKVTSWTDNNNNGSANVGTDDIQEVETDYVSESGVWYARTRTYGYINSGTRVMLNETKSRLAAHSGASSSYGNLISEVKSQDGGGFDQTVKTYVKPVYRARYIETTVDGSSIKGLQHFKNGLLQSSKGTTYSNAWTYSYDGLGRRTEALNPRTYTSIKSTYDSNSGKVTATWKQNGSNVDHQSYYYYGNGSVGAGRVSRIYNHGNASNVRMSYDTRGNLTHRWGDGDYPVAYEYDSLGRRKKMHTYRSGSWTGSTVASASFESNQDTTTWNYYTGDGYLQSKVDDSNKTVSYDYNHNGTPKSRTWARGVVTNYTYHSYASGVPSYRLNTVDYPSGSGNQDVIYRSYDAGGKPKEIVDMAGEHNLSYFANGGITLDDINYDSASGAHNFLQNIDVDPEQNSYGWFSGYKVKKSGSTVADVSYQFSNGRLSWAYDDRFGYRVSVGYASASDLPSSKTYYKDYTNFINESVSYDSFDRVQTISYNSGSTTHLSHTYTYDSMSRRTAATRESGSKWNYGYDKKGQLTSAYKQVPSSSDRFRGLTFEYSYDSIGNRTTAKSGGNTSGGGLRTVTYPAAQTNALNQYVQVTHPNTFDVSGSSSSSTIYVNGSVADRQNGDEAGSNDYFHKELTGYSPPDLVNVEIDNNTSPPVLEEFDHFVPAATQVLSYDDDGNVLSDGQWSYTWNAENRLYEMESASSAIPNSKKVKVRFYYDYLGRRIAKKIYSYDGGWQLDTQESYVYIGWNCVARFVDSVDVQTYIWGNDLSGPGAGYAGAGAAGGTGGLLFVQDLSSSYSHQNTHVPCFDGNGNVIELYEQYYSSAFVTATYEYDGFGREIRNSGYFADDNPWRFSSRYTDDEIGRVYFGYRYYDPEHGRWLSRDPIEEDGGVNLYGFTMNNGVNYIDRLGLDTLRSNPVAAAEAVGNAPGAAAAAAREAGANIGKKIATAPKGKPIPPVPPFDPRITDPPPPRRRECKDSAGRRCQCKDMKKVRLVVKVPSEEKYHRAPHAICVQHAGLIFGKRPSSNTVWIKGHYPREGMENFALFALGKGKVVDGQVKKDRTQVSDLTRDWNIVEKYFACPVTMKALRASVYSSFTPPYDPSNIGARNCAGWAVSKLRSAGFKTTMRPWKYNLLPVDLLKPGQIPKYRM